MKRLIFSLCFLGALSLSSCRICLPTSKNLAYALSQTEIAPLSVAELRELLTADSTHYKIVVFGSPCCGPCEQDVPRQLQLMAEWDSSRVSWYHVIDAFEGVEFALNRGFPQYFLYDTLPRYWDHVFDSKWQGFWSLFSPKKMPEDFNLYRLSNIVNDVLPIPYKIEDAYGFPCYLILNPQNVLKRVVNVYTTGTSRLAPMDLRDVNCPPWELDFSTVDTLHYNYEEYTPEGPRPTQTDEGPKVCTPEGCW